VISSSVVPRFSERDPEIPTDSSTSSANNLVSDSREPPSAIKTAPLLVNEFDALDIPSEQELGRSKRKKIPNRFIYGSKSCFAGLHDNTKDLCLDDMINHLTQEDFARLTPEDRMDLLMTPNEYLSSEDTLRDLDWSTTYSNSYAMFNYFNNLGTDPDSNEITWWHPMSLTANRISTARFVIDGFPVLKCMTPST
jgi:hypothetical protein